jgi:hypothetical protein
MCSSFFYTFSPHPMTAKVCWPLEWQWRDCNKKGLGRVVGWSEWWVGLLAGHCYLLACVISALPREKITSLWLEMQKAFQCTICSLALMACINKQTNQEMLVWFQAPRPIIMGDNGSVTIKDGKILKVEEGWLQTCLWQILYMFSIHGNDKCS